MGSARRKPARPAEVAPCDKAMTARDQFRGCGRSACATHETLHAYDFTCHQKDGAPQLQCSLSSGGRGRSSGRARRRETWRRSPRSEQGVCGPREMLHIFTTNSMASSSAPRERRSRRAGAIPESPTSPFL